MKIKFITITKLISGGIYVTAYNFYKDSSSQTSRKLFRFSLLHLPLLMTLFLLNKKKWYAFSKDEDDVEEISEFNK